VEGGLKRNFEEQFVQWCTNNDVNDLGRYEVLARPQAIHGSSMIGLKSLIALLLEHNNTMEYTMQSLKDPLMAAVRMHPKLNNTKFQTQHWASFRAERLLTLCCHYRRLAMDAVRFRQCASKCTADEVEQLQELSSRYREPGEIA
jgi:hypothetical protein